MDKEQLYLIEDVVLGLAEMVRENRTLRVENERLRKVEEEYYQSINDRCRASEEASLNMLRAACAGVVIGKNDMEQARELVEYV